MPQGMRGHPGERLIGRLAACHRAGEPGFAARGTEVAAVRCGPQQVLAALAGGGRGGVMTKAGTRAGALPSRFG